MSMRAGLTSSTGAISRLSPEFYNGGPVGIETIAAALSEPRDAIEEIVEPYLIQQGFIQRTPRGRMLTALAFQHMGIGRAAGFCRACRASLFEEPESRAMVEHRPVLRHDSMVCFDDGAARFQMRAAGIAIRQRASADPEHQGRLRHVPAGWPDRAGRGERRDAGARDAEEEFGHPVEVGRLAFVIESFYPEKAQVFHEVGLYYRIEVAR